MVTKDSGGIMDIDIEDLFIDECNIRKEIQQQSHEDLDLVKSIKKFGVLQNLIVRPYNIEGKTKYGIVCGSRRYTAAVKARVNEIQCRVLELDDISAMGLSFTENENRRDIPRWRVIDWIFKMNDKISKKVSQSKMLKALIKNSALSTRTVKRYLKIGGLPSKVKILLKKHDERTENEKDILKKYIPYGYIKCELTIGIADLIAEYLINLPEELLFEHTIDLLKYPITTNGAGEIIKHLKDNPERSVEEIINTIIKESSKFRTLTLKLDKSLYNRLEELCVERKIKLLDLILNLIKEGLKTY